MTAPPRTEAQRVAALEAALDARQERARLRQALKRRELSAADVITGSVDNPVWAAVRVSWLLECVPGLGSVRVATLMERVGIAPTRRVKGLGVHQRAALVSALAAHP